MKMLLALLLLIPSLSWGEPNPVAMELRAKGEYLELKDVPTSKKDLNYLFGHTIGENFEMSLLTQRGMEKIQKPLGNENYPYTWISRNAKKKDGAFNDFEGEIFNKDFDTFGVTLDSNQVISGLYLQKDWYKENLTSQLSDLMDTFNLESLKNIGEFSEINFSNCADFSKKFLKAYKFKRNINEKFLDKYFYTTTKGSKDVSEFISDSILKDKEGRVALTECYYYYLGEERDVSSNFNFIIYSPELFEARGLRFKDWYDDLDFYEIKKDEFEKFFKLHSEFDTSGL